MENQRLILFVALSVVILLLYSSWQEQYGPKPPTPSQSVQSPEEPTPAGISSPAAPIAPGETPDVALSQPATTPAVAGAQAINSQQSIRVRTDLFDVVIDTMGGDIRQVALLQYPEHADTPEKPVQLFNDSLPRLLIAQSGLLSSSGQSFDHRLVFATEATDYELAGGADSLEVTLTYQDPSGISVKKTYTFHRDRYVINMNMQVINASEQDWSGRLYRQFQSTQASEGQTFIYTYTGGVVSTPKTRYEKVNFDDMADWKPEESFSQGGWAAMIQHYFLGAWIPEQDQFNNFYTKVVGGTRYILGLQTGETKVPAGETGVFTSQLYVGPKEHARLVDVAPNLELTVDYGFLTILAEPLFWLLTKIHGLVGNWGFAIIFVTLIIKLVFYKLSESAYRSMANLRKFQPKIQALRERYGNDRQKMSQAMMDIYKKEKINPLGGCLPMLVQIPVFIALYWVLLESVELRQADFILWIDDLSSKDPYYVLPVIMGVSMWVQQKLNPAPMDPVQQKVLMALPFVFTAFFAFFPSGLVLYWVVNNILSIAQQWYITRKIEAQTAKT
ncbi:MAG: insertase [Gammaproteobacteria bacterium SG8_11]|nr:MAG: insertase [Gammaproteobacteria bacterium SG8_11]